VINVKGLETTKEEAKHLQVPYLNVLNKSNNPHGFIWTFENNAL
jgi:hypothetical protein